MLEARKTQFHAKGITAILLSDLALRSTLHSSEKWVETPSLKDGFTLSAGF